VRIGILAGEDWQVLKGKQKKHAVVEALDASGKISRKQFEGELAKLQVELTRLQMGQRQGGARHCGFRGPGHGG
jgi:hypothetical protein